MIRSEKKIKDLAQILNKDNIILISDAITLLREEQPFEGAIGLLTALYDKTDDYSVRKAVEGFMNDLKDQTAEIEVIAELRKELKPDTISMLVASCWQSGLDYSEYSLDFANIFLKGDYVTAIECLTVIEDSANDLTDNKREEIIKLINDSPLAHAKEKAELTYELLAILNR
jgi:hypothetical protein